MGRYAKDTKVPVEKSRGDISAILTRYGCVRMAWATEPSGDTLHFELDGRSFRFSIIRPTSESMRTDHAHEYAYPHNIDWEAKAEQEWRRRWRAHVLLLKAKLEFVDGGDTTIVREFMANLLTPDGRTVGEVVLDGGIPQLPAVATGSS